MLKNNISVEQVEHVAKLSNLPINKEEANKLSELFSKALDYINVIEELDTSNVLPTFQVTGLKNVFMKKDKNTATLSQEEALSNAASSKNGLFVAEAVFDR